MSSINETPKEPLIDRLSNRVSQISNKLTEYEPVEKAKNEVHKCDTQFASARENMKVKNKFYEDAVLKRTELQQNINNLLYRKPNWTNNELNLFTEYCQQELVSDTELKERKSAYLEAETKLDESHNEYINALRKHYNEEQIWTDKSRRISVYFSSLLFIANTIILLLSLAVFEPKRRQLMVDDVVARLTTSKDMDSPTETLSTKVQSEEKVFLKEVATLKESLDGATNVIHKKIGDLATNFEEIRGSLLNNAKNGNTEKAPAKAASFVETQAAEPPQGNLKSLGSFFLVASACLLYR